MSSYTVEQIRAVMARDGFTDHADAEDAIVDLLAALSAKDAEIARLEAEVARLRPLAAPVWPDDPDALR